ncbi:MULTISPECIES: acyltransferase [Atopobiaceae]|uniref:Surface polysaccharide O-acyltransferase, integral membrane enzyme n=1 Tax=Parafannyhessea umbonata TaxID=604330 RepID=A0A1H6HSD3_9ACTN|nr:MULTISPECIES: acyltransferase family protein [Atopobiaceae]SEH38761.1 Surface polysaccharide O-acyltransferase, integral membrane enzyme [Parafannyhessea umbonata]SJZ42090.1 Surface polysaccharide O-acyltransferase, integral membrane enzyme [Olsenella sp. KH1P3]
MQKSLTNEAKATSHARRLSLDLIRWVAIFLVLVTHLSPFFLGPSHPAAASLFCAAGRIGVPLFVMLTGYLMLGRDYSGDYLGRYLKRNLLGIFVAYEVWNVVWCLLSKLPGLPDLQNGFPIGFGRMAKAALLVGDTGSALWYLVLTLGIYLGLPLLSRAVAWLEGEGEGRSALRRLLLAAALYFGLLVPSAQTLCGFFGVGEELHSVLNLNLFGATVWGESVWVLYLLAGYAARRGALRRVPAAALGACLLASFGIFSGMQCLSMTAGFGSPLSYSFAPVALCSVCLFEAIDRAEPLLVRAPQAFRSLCSCVSRWSFATYMLHFWVLAALLAALRLAGLDLSALQGASWALGVLAALGSIALVHCGTILAARLLSLAKPVARWAFLAK